MAHYSRESLAQTLRSLNIHQGDTLFSHIALAPLGLPEEIRSGISPAQVLLDAVFDVIGKDGLWVVPAYSHNFTNYKEGLLSPTPFDPETPNATTGPFPNWLIKNAIGIRSHDPIYSVIAIGRPAHKFLNNLPSTCFGKDCIYERLENKKAKLCNIGAPTEKYLTMLHFIEQEQGVIYRYAKPALGTIINQGKEKFIKWEAHVRVLHPESYGSAVLFIEKLKSKGVYKKADNLPIEVFDVKKGFSIARQMCQIHQYPFTIGQNMDAEWIQKQIQKELEIHRKRLNDLFPLETTKVT